MDSLREEVVKSQEQRHQLFKWKLMLVAALGGMGLGLSGGGSSTDTLGPRVDHVLCLIPLVCLYVDLLSRNLNLRMFVIGHFLSMGTGRHSRYERFAEQARALRWKRGTLDTYRLEDWALEWSTGLLSLAVCAYGLWKAASVAEFDWRSMEWLSEGGGFVGVGLLGLVCSQTFGGAYRRRRRALDDERERVLRRGDD